MREVQGKVGKDKNEDGVRENERQKSNIVTHHAVCIQNQRAVVMAVAWPPQNLLGPSNSATKISGLCNFFTTGGSEIVSRLHLVVFTGFTLPSRHLTSCFLVHFFQKMRHHMGNVGKNAKSQYSRQLLQHSILQSTNGIYFWGNVVVSFPNSNCGMVWSCVSIIMPHSMRNISYTVHP